MGDVAKKEFSFVIVAGGSGTRMNGKNGERKQFIDIGGRPLWRLCADTAAGLFDKGIREIVLVLPKDTTASAIDEIKRNWDATVPLVTAEGGAERADSVLNGIMSASCDYVMVHDAARPFASKELLLRLMEETSETEGAVPLLPVSDALKHVCGDDIAKVNRDGLFATQTPQSFHRTTLISALEKHGAGAKDEAEAWLAANLTLRRVEGERLNFKVTWRDDLKLARALTGEKTIRTGLGYDVHRLVPERPLIIGGVRIKDSPLGLLGHSDADLLSHAIADALLGAAGLPDIGNLFPANDDTYKDADSVELLKRAAELVRANGWRVEWVDAAVQAQVPRLNSYIPEMKKRLSDAINPGGPDCVNIKAKSAEGIGDAGMGGSMNCWAVATLSLRDGDGEDGL